MNDSDKKSEPLLVGRHDSYIRRVEAELRSGSSQKYKWFEHLDSWCQSIRPMGMLEIALSVIGVYAGFWLLSFLIASQPHLAEFESTQAAVIVGLIGVYLGFSTLSIQLHAGRAEGQAAVAVPFIVRTHWLYLNWGIGLGVVVANIAALALLDVDVPFTLHGITVANYLSGILIASLIARFLYMTVSDATLDMAGFVMRIAPKALAERVELVRRTNGVRNAFSSTHTLPFRASSHADDIEIVASADSGKWFVGIDVAGVKGFVSWLKSYGYEVSHVDIPIEDDGVATLLLRPNESDIKTEVTIEVATSGPMAIRGSESVQADSAAIEELASRKFKNALISKDRQGHTGELLLKSLSIWHHALVDAANGGRSGELELRLGWVSNLIAEISGKNALKEAISDRMSRSGVIGDPPIWVDIHAIADAVLCSSNPLSLDAIIDFIESAAITGKNQNDHILVDRALGVLQYIHYQAHPRQRNGSQKFYSRTERQLDSFVKSKLSMQYWSKSQFHITDRMFLALGLSLTKTAIELGEVEAARSFANRLNECFWDGEPSQSFVAPDGKSPKDDVILGIIALQGWCIAMMERKADLPSRQGAAEAVLEVLRCPVTDSRYLLWLWETYGGIGRNSDADVKLLLGHWDPDTETDEPERPGMSSAHMVDESWGLKGLLMLLIKAGSPIGQLGQYFSGPPPKRLWDHQSVSSAFEKIAKLSNLDTQEQELVPKITDMLWRRERWGLAEFAKSVAEFDIASTPRLKKLLSSVSDVEGMPFPGFEILTDLGVAENAVAKTEETVVAAAMGVPRDYFVEGNSWASGFGKHLRDVIGKRNSMAGFWSAEQSVSQFKKIESEADVRAAVDLAIKDLRNKKFNPDILIIPDTRRPEFLEWIFEKKRWELADRRPECSLYLGREQGLAILQWPYTNASSILIAEAKYLFGFQSKDSEVSVDWTDASDEDKQSLLNVIKLEMDAVKSDSPLPAAQPDPRSLNVRVTAQQPARLGVLDVLAARKIDVSALLNKEGE